MWQNSVGIVPYILKAFIVIKLTLLVTFLLLTVLSTFRALSLLYASTFSDPESFCYFSIWRPRGLWMMQSYVKIAQYQRSSYSSIFFLLIFHSSSSRLCKYSILVRKIYFLFVIFIILQSSHLILCCGCDRNFYQKSKHGMPLFIKHVWHKTQNIR
jgi:hypothetical protein